MEPRTSRAFARLSVMAAMGIFSGGAGAAGFALIEQSASGVGNAFAGEAASAQDAGTIFFNPAGMTHLPGLQVVVGVNAVRPNINFTNQGSTLNPPSSPIAPLTGGNGGDGGSWVYIPNLYLSWQLDDKWWVGLGVNAPFGAKTEYEQGWVGRYQALNTDLKTININPSIAYKVNDKVSLGLGLSAQYVDATLTKAIDTGTICDSALGALTCQFGLGLVPQGHDASQELSATDWGYGFNLGALFQISPDMRIGVAYRSQIKFTLSGTSTFSGVPAPLNTSPALQTSAATADLTVPDSASLSVFQTFGDKWELMGDITWTHWDVFDQLVVNFANGAPSNTTPENWKNAWRFSLGLNYKFNESWKLRTGVAWDQTPVPNPQMLTARIPDNNRTWLAVGGSWYFTKGASLDLSYAHLFVPNTSIDRTEQASGTLIGSFNNSINIVSLQVVYSF